MPIEQYTYWSVTINNPDENDYLIMRNPNEKYIRSLVWTPEVGKEGTEHIQAWIRLQRNQGLSFVKKLYPRAHLKPVDKDVYNENTHQYVQKNDDTTAGNHHISINDPLPANDTLLYNVLRRSFDYALANSQRLKDLYEHESMKSVLQALTLKELNTELVEREMVREKAGLEKIFISPAYEKMKRKYWSEILYRLYIQTEDARSTSQRSERSETRSRETQTDSEDYEDSRSTEDEGLSESGSSCDSEEDDESQY